ncbi:MAG: hypothetical protein FWG25_01180 [Promicromonosporaceae bacterium]|nr:hypothetical protein [Promicromonosporaceae bacterium]
MTNQTPKPFRLLPDAELAAYLRREYLQLHENIGRVTYGIEVMRINNCPKEDIKVRDDIIANLEKRLVIVANQRDAHSMHIQTIIAERDEARQELERLRRVNEINGAPHMVVRVRKFKARGRKIAELTGQLDRARDTACRLEAELAQRDDTIRALDRDRAAWRLRASELNRTTAFWRASSQQWQEVWYSALKHRTRQAATIEALDKDRAAWRDLAIQRLDQSGAWQDGWNCGTDHGWEQRDALVRTLNECRNLLASTIQHARHAISVALGQEPGDVMPELMDGISMLKSDRDKFKALYQARHEQMETKKARAETAEERAETAEQELAELDRHHQICEPDAELRKALDEANQRLRDLAAGYPTPEIRVRALIATSVAATEHAEAAEQELAEVKSQHCGIHASVLDRRYEAERDEAYRLLADALGVETYVDLVPGISQLVEQRDKWRARWR